MKHRTPQVTAVIVTYQSCDTIGLALDALRDAHEAGLANAVVVDNVSTDGTADLVADGYPWVTLVRSDNNIGYGRACNRGFEYVKTPYVLILNPDAVVNLKALRALIQFMERTPDAGLAAPATVLQDDDYQAVGLMTTPITLLRASFGSTRPYPDERAIRPGDEPCRVSWICGAIMLIRTEVFRELGGFDSRFFLYFEETDLCRRAARHGCDIWAVGTAVAYHAGGASAVNTSEVMHSLCIAEHYYRSRFYYLVKHFGWLRAGITEAIIAAAHIVRSLRHWMARRTPDQRVACLRRPFFQFPSRPRKSVHRDPT